MIVFLSQCIEIVHNDFTEVCIIQNEKKGLCLKILSEGKINLIMELWFHFESVGLLLGVFRYNGLGD